MPARLDASMFAVDLAFRSGAIEDDTQKILM